MKIKKFETFFDKIIELVGSAVSSISVATALNAQNTRIFSSSPFFQFNLKFIKRCHNAIKCGVVNKSTTVNRFFLHTLHRNIAHLAVITRKTNIKLDTLR